MMHLYGRHMCLIDATYRTNIYEMPLFFLCVLTNCGYVNVATFLLSDEQKDSVAAGLTQIAEWNAEWQPQCFVSDFSEAQIAALENVFPGMWQKMLFVTVAIVNNSRCLSLCWSLQYSAVDNVQHSANYLYCCALHMFHISNETVNVS